MRNQTCRHLDLGLLASRTARKHVSIIETTQSVALCSRSLKELTQELWGKIKQGNGTESNGLVILLWSGNTAV